jgi:hypothetical protein
MLNLRLPLFCLVLCLLAGGRAESQVAPSPIYYNTSSSTLSANTLDSVATNGTGNAPVLTATGNGLNNVNRCTAVAVDALNGRLFFIDGQANAIWSVNLNGTGLVLVKSGLTSYPTDLALDVLNEKIYFTTSSTVQNNNTVQEMDYTGNNNVTLFTASGPVANGGNGVSRCTALAVDLLNSKMFLADAGAQKIWSMTLAGGSLTALATNAAGSFPTGLALDVTNQQVYFTVSSPTQGANLIQQVSYKASGLVTRFTASGSVQRCTALDLDLAHGIIYFSDAGARTLWRVPVGGGGATSVLGGLTATAKKVRWFSGPATRPPPALVGMHLSGTNVVFNATNGYIGGTYYVLTSTNLTTPLNQWLPVSSNVLAATGNFSLTATNGFASQKPRQFYVLQVH